MFHKIPFFSSKDKGFSWWWLGVKVGVVTAVIIWWWLENRRQKSTPQTPGRALEEERLSIPLPVEDMDPGEPSQAAPVAPQAPVTPDDLTKIEGIGPKINATLQQAGIRTYAQLAASKPAILKQILLDAGVRIGFPDTWPEQAVLAAKDDWDALATFKSSLKGGRRVG